MIIFDNIYVRSEILAITFLFLAAGCSALEGEDGNANVYYSQWEFMHEENWSESFNFFTQIRREYPVPEAVINDEILTSGMVLVFVRTAKLTGNDVVFTLPAILNITKTDSQHLGAELKTGFITIVFHDLDGAEDPGIIPSGFMEYRYIILPGGTPVHELQSLVNMNDYYSVTEYFEIDP